MTEKRFLKLCEKGVIQQPHVKACPFRAMKPLPLNRADFEQPAWEKIIERAFPTWKHRGPCPSLDAVGGQPNITWGSQIKGTRKNKFTPCYYTKRYAGLDPKFGGYPTPIDTHYPFEYAAPFTGQPGDGSVHRCPCGSPPNTNIASCPKFQHNCGKDCANVECGKIGHVPPFVALHSVVREYKSNPEGLCPMLEEGECHLSESALTALVLKYFSADGGDTVRWQPPILIDGKPSNTYFRLEYGGEGCDQENVACFGPHYCTKEVGDDGRIWGDFCPYVHVGANSGKYRHPHIALAAVETFIAHECRPRKCRRRWLKNNPDYPPAEPTSITWCQMDADPSGIRYDPMAQPSVPYQWPLEAGEIPDLTSRQCPSPANQEDVYEE